MNSKITHKIENFSHHLTRMGKHTINSIPQNIVFISTMSSTPWGGSEELWSRAAMLLRSQGHTVNASIVKWKDEHDKVKELRDHGISLKFWSTKKSLANQIFAKFSIFKNINFNLKSIYLRNIRPDLVVISQGYTLDGLEWAIICKRLNIKYCIIVHANSEQWWPEDKQLNLIRECYSSSSRVFCVSESNRKLLEWQCGMLLQQSEVISNPWHSDTSKGITWPKPNEICRIACVGRLDQRAKGQDIIIRLLAMQKWRQRLVHVNFFGKGPLLESLVNLATMNSVDRISFFGHVQSIAEIWQDNEALLLPSRYEGMPIAIIEAMMAGRVVITTDIGGNAEHIIDNENGFIANAPNLNSLDEALERAWAMHKSWEQIGSKARDHIISKINFDPVVKFCDKITNIKNLSSGN